MVEPVGGAVPAARQLAAALVLALRLCTAAAICAPDGQHLLWAGADGVAAALARERMALTLLTPLLPAILAGATRWGR